MPGVDLHQTSRRSQLQIKNMVLGPVPADDPDFFTDTPLDISAIAVGDDLLASLDRTRFPNFGANPTGVVTNAGASTADITLSARGKNQFGENVVCELANLSKAGGAVAGDNVILVLEALVVTAIDGAVGSGDTLDFGFGLKRGLPMKLDRDDRGQIKNIFRSANTPVLVDIDADTIDVDESALLGTATNGAGSSSGAFAAGDQFDIAFQFDSIYDTDKLTR